ncbi:MAG: error-prone DNA polymerase [Chloroflexota bacterium]|nr:MAG: error-prone DNA polymerase [Chloroflexota bacterium]
MDYVELHCHSNYSLLDGASHPEELVARAVELGMPALALTDHDNVYGVVHFAQAAQAAGLRPIFGAELTLASGYHLTLLVENEVGWTNLCRLISCAQHNAPKGQAALPPLALAGQTDGLIALSGCQQGEVAVALLRKDWDAALRAARHYRELFGPDHFWLELQHHLRPEDGVLVDGLVAVARQLGLNYVATNNVHYATRNGQRLQDVLVCIRHRTNLDEAGPLLRPNSEFYLKPARQIAPLFATYPRALTNTLQLADRCHFELRYGLQELPRFPIPLGLDAGTYLHQLCHEAIPCHYPDPPERVWEQLNHEVAVIQQVGLANYFLIVWDIVRYAREHGIRCQGRGSAASSLVAFLLGISPIDPLANGLVFERFLSAERSTAADIDLDFQADRREEVIQYIYGLYGTEYAAMACTFVTFQARSARREVGQALGLSPALLNQVIDHSDDVDESQETKDVLTPLRELCRQIDGFPRHLGLHNGAFVITGAPLATRVPTEPAAMMGRVVVQWDKEALEAVGLVKIDILGLRMLSAIVETVAIIKEIMGQTLDLGRLTFDDPAVYEMIVQTDTIGAFQVESRAQTQILPRLKPHCLADLVICISLIRPGPIQGNMVHPYLRRRLGQEPVTYLHPRLEAALAETLGVILFQEQVIKVAGDLAGFRPGQGEQLRRALGSKRGAAEIERLRSAFLTGAQANGVSLDIAETIFAHLQAFGGYSFAKSHAAAFAVLVYQSAWLKRYYPAAFVVSLLNNHPMGFWSPAVILGDARRHGIAVLPVDLHRSQVRCVVENGSIRLGFNYVAGLGKGGSARVVEARSSRDFTGLVDFCRRTRLARHLIENLILAGAMDGWGIPRRQLLWELGQIRYREEELDLSSPIEELKLPPLTQAEALMLEREVLGLSTGEHVMALYRGQLAEKGILGSAELAAQLSGRQVWIAGLMVVHQAPPTAKGHHFLTLEDENGLIDVIVRPQIVTQIKKLPSWENHGLNDQTLLLVEGIVQQNGNTASVLATRIQSLITNASSGTSANSG